MTGNLLRNWFVPKDGISREVISADIQRFLGNDATVRPGKEVINQKEVCFVLRYSVVLPRKLIPS